MIMENIVDIYKLFDTNINEIINQIEKIDNIKFKKILIFSILDSMTQTFGLLNNIQKTQAKAFADFIEKMAPKYEFLNKIDIITLLYEKGVDEEKIGFDKINKIKNIEISEMLRLYEDIKIEESVRDINIRENHKYSMLLYKYRSKLVHEFNAPTHIFEKIETSDLPLYININNGIEVSILTTKNWKNREIELIFPYTFIKMLTLECLKNFIEYCKKNRLNPMEKLKYKSWYEKSSDYDKKRLPI